MDSVRIPLAVATCVMLAAGPVHAGTGTSGPVTVSVNDATWTSYDCQTTTVTLTVTLAEYQPWVTTIQASPDGRSRLDATAFADIGSNVMTKSLLICPADSNGPWTAVVQTRLLSETIQFSVPFTVSKVASTTTLNRARYKNKVLRVSGSVLGVNGIAGRASIAVLRLRDGTWRTMGHTNANRNGVFRFLAPKKAEQVRVDYLGDSVTLPSQNQGAVEVVRPKKD